MTPRVIETAPEKEVTSERELAALEALYRRSPNGLAILDRSLRYVRVNEALAHFHGTSSEELIGQRLVDLLSADCESIAGDIERASKLKASLPEFIFSLKADGNETARRFAGHFYPLETAYGDEHSGLVVWDVTSKYSAAENLRRSEARYRDLVEHSVYGACVVSKEGLASGANAAMLRILGCSTPEELTSMNLLRDVFRYPDQQAQLFASCRESGSVQNGEAEWRRRDGGIVSIRLHLRRMMRTEEAETIEIVAEDVTELRALERQLHQAQKFEAIGQLAGGIAHDFNNVIGAILGWAELGFEQNRDYPKTADRFARIREQGERAAALTRELLAFARRQVLQPRAVDLNAVIRGLVAFLERVIGKDIELELETLPLEAIKADPTQVEQVLMNLCINARDAMPDGGKLSIESGMVEVDEAYARFYPGVVPGRYAVLAVSDSGSGMDAKTLEHIFEPFFTTKESGKGTGLGLSTVYGIVKQHGGFLHVYSEPGQGSLFRVYFPAIPGKFTENSIPAVPSVEELRGSETVLVADDHESLREMARQTLSSLGYRVLCAADGEEALQLCEQTKPQIAVLDVVMPKLGGCAAGEKLSARYPGLPIIFTSGYSRDRDERTAKIEHASYLQKPYSPTRLGKMVREVLNLAKSSTE